MAILAIFAIQFAITRRRHSFRWVRQLTDSEPLLLIENGRILHDDLKFSRVIKDGRYANLLEADIFRIVEVRAVILKTTCDISFLHSSDLERTLDADVLKGVRKRV